MDWCICERMNVPSSPVLTRLVNGPSRIVTETLGAGNSTTEHFAQVEAQSAHRQSQPRGKPVAVGVSRIHHVIEAFPANGGSFCDGEDLRAVSRHPDPSHLSARFEANARPIVQLLLHDAPEFQEVQDRFVRSKAKGDPDGIQQSGRWILDEKASRFSEQNAR